MQQVDDPPYLTVGTEVSAKYKGAFCEAKVRKVVRNIKCRVAYKLQGLGSGIVSDDQIKGALRVGAAIEVKHPDRKEFVEATLTKIQDCSQYTVVFDDGDITTLRRSALCLKSGRHFNESETLDQLPLTHPEHFGNPVIGGRRGRRSRHLLQDDSSDEEDEQRTNSRTTASDKEENIGKVVCVESNDTKKKGPKENWFPGLVVAPTAQDTVRIRVKDEYLVRSFKDGRYYTVPKKEATEFTRELANKQEGAAVTAALEFLNNDSMPPHWDRDALFGVSASSSDYEQEFETDSSDDEPTEEKDHFVAQLYKFMDDRGTPLNKGPSIINRDVDLYRLFRAVQKLGGYNRVTSQNQWKSIALRLGFSPATASITNLVKQAYKKFLHSFEEFNRKLGCTMVAHPRANRVKGRSLVRANSVASPKLSDTKEVKEDKRIIAIIPPVVEESGNTSESSSAEPIKTKRKMSTNSGKVKALVEKYEEKEKEKEKVKELKIVVKDEGASTSKKEKPMKKTDDKRGRKRKDNDSIESKKEKDKDTEPLKIPSFPTTSHSLLSLMGPSPTPAPTGGMAVTSTTTLPDFPIEVSDKLKVYYDEQKVTYEAKVIEIAIQESKPIYLVHYTGWNTRYDEWVRKERIAENLTNNKTKKGKGGTPKSSGNPPNNNLSTPKSGKRCRGNSKVTPAHRRVTRGQPTSNRRTSNNTDISSLSMQTDTTDSDSDEPIKKLATNSNSLSSTSSNSSSTKVSTTAEAGSSSDAAAISDEFSNGASKGRDYDLNQIRSELKGFKELKSPASPASDIATDVVSTHTTLLAVESKIKSHVEEAIDKVVKIEEHSKSSESESLSEEDSSQSSNKAFSSSPITAMVDSEPEPPTPTPATPIKQTTTASKSRKSLESTPTKVIEKVVEKSAEKVLPKTKAPLKTYGPSSNVDSSVGGSDTNKFSFTKEKSDSDKLLNESLIIKDIMEKVVAPSPTKSTKVNLAEKVVTSIVENPTPIAPVMLPIPASLATSPTATTTATTMVTTPVVSTKPEKKIVEKKLSPMTTTPVVEKISPKVSGSNEKLKHFSSSSLTAAQNKNFSKEAAKINSLLEAAAKQDESVADIYEFKESEPFEFESSRKHVSDVPAPVVETIAQMATAPSLVVEEKKPTKKGLSRKQETADGSVNVIGKKTKKSSPSKAETERLKQLRKEKEERDKSIEIAIEALSNVSNSSIPCSLLTPEKSSATAARIESTFDVLRKSPNFNMVAHRDDKPLDDIKPECSSKISVSKSIFMPIKSPIPSEMMMEDFKFLPKSPSEDDKSQLDLQEDDMMNVNKMVDFEFESTTKIEKPCSIADKVLKAMNQQISISSTIHSSSSTIPETSAFSLKTEKLDLPKYMLPIIHPLMASKLLPETPIKIEPLLNEPPKIEVSCLLKKEIEMPIKSKPILSSPDHKIDIMDMITPKNTILTETIEKLDERIQKSNMDRFPDESSDSTDSEHRLVIEDESQSSETNQIQLHNEQTDFESLIKAEMEEKALSEAAAASAAAVAAVANKDKIYFQPIPDIDIREDMASIKITDSSMKKTPSILETIIQSELNTVNRLGSHSYIIKKDQDFAKEELERLKKEEQQQQLIAAAAAAQPPDPPPEKQNSESLSLLLCEETIPGSPAPVCGISASAGNSKEPSDLPISRKVYADSTSFVQPQNIASDLKPVPMDIEPNEHETDTTAIIKLSKSESAETPNSSPRDSLSQDESKSDSEDLKKPVQEPDVSPKKRRQRKISETEPTHKRRRAAGASHYGRSNSHRATDSEDNSDSMAVHRTGAGKSPRPCQYNFLVNLDPALNSNQRISILKKKIQELRKTYNSIKAELASIDRRRKKLRRRERENKKNAKLNNSNNNS